jgi:hypothetical protein
MSASKFTGYDSSNDEQAPQCRTALAVSPDLEAANKLQSFPFSGPSSLNGMVTKAKDMKINGKVGIRDRIACHQWTWFTMTMVSRRFRSVNCRC